jgi:hypothetical protein
MPLGVVQHLLVAPLVGSLHPGGQPVHAHRLADLGHLPKALLKLGQGGDGRAVGLAEPKSGQLAKQQVQAVADLGLGDPDHAASAPYDSPSRITAATASRRTSNDSGGVPPRPGGRGGISWARWQASQASTSAGSDKRGRYDNGTRPPGRRRHLAYGLVPSTSGRPEHHGHPQ